MQPGGSVLLPLNSVGVWGLTWMEEVLSLWVYVVPARSFLVCIPSLWVSVAKCRALVLRPDVFALLGKMSGIKTLMDQCGTEIQSVLDSAAQKGCCDHGYKQELLPGFARSTHIPFFTLLWQGQFVQPCVVPAWCRRCSPGWGGPEHILLGCGRQ